MSRVTQVEAIHAWAHKRNIWDKFTMLQDSSEYTFKEIGNTRYKSDKTHDLELFLGQNRNHQTWALLRTFPLKASEVVFLNKFPDREAEIVTSFTEFSLQYPFRVYKKKQVKDTMRYLKIFIQYIYLDAGHIDKVFPDELKYCQQALGRAVEMISRHYVEKGGVESIPDYHEPEPVSNMSPDDDAETDVETPPNQRRPKRSASRLLQGKEKALKMEKAMETASTKKGASDDGLVAVPYSPPLDMQPFQEEPIDDIREESHPTPMPNVEAVLERAAALNHAYVQYKMVEKRKKAVQARLAEVKRQVRELAALEKELTARIALYTNEMAEILEIQPKEEIIRWMIAPKSVEDDDVN